MVSNFQRSRGKFLLIITLLIAASLACSLPFIGGNQKQPAATQPSPSKEEPASDPGDVQRCEHLGYPCSYAEAAPEKLDRSLALMDLADEVFAEDGSTLAVAERLQAEDDLAEMVYDERGVWYRVQGAPPMVFLHPQAFDALSRETGRQQPPSGAPVLLRPYRPELDGPIGTNPPGEKALKRALFVVPLAWDYGADVHARTAPLLRETRDYQCEDCVNLLAGEENARELVSPEQPTAGPSLAQFQGWEAYDLIHVYAHGYQFCPGQSVTTSGQPVVSGDREEIPENTAGIIEGARVEEGDCVTLIQTGHYQTRDHLTTNPSSTAGVAWTHKPGSEVWGEVVTTDFFHSAYPEGLNDKVIYFSSCQTMRDESLANALIGTNTAVLGWTDSVYSQRGEAAAVQFFTELIENGLRASTAHQNTVDSSSHQEHSEDWFGANLKLVQDEGLDPRGREVVTLLHPATREKLQDGGSTVTYGMPEDGEQDKLYVTVQVDGVDEEQSPEDFVVHVRLNDEELDQTFTADPELQVGETSYLAQGAVTLPYDVTNTEQVKLETWAELPEGGDTRQVLDEVRPVGCGWSGTLSGPISGEYEGLIMDMQALFDSMNSGAFNEMLGAFDMPGMSGMPDLNSPVGKTWVITFPPEEKLVGSLMVEIGLSTISDLEGVSKGLMGYNTENLSYQQNQISEEDLRGSFSGAYYSIKFEDNQIQRGEGPSFEGEFIYHDQALCNVDILVEINKNFAQGADFLP